MEDVMRVNVKFPALMAARPPKYRSPKICVCAFDTVVDLEEMSQTDFPVALQVRDENQYYRDKRHIVYRTAGGRLYTDSRIDVERFLQHHADQVLDVRDRNQVTGKIMREIRREVMGAKHVNEDHLWMSSAVMQLLRSGMNSEWPLVRTILSTSSRLELDGPWRSSLAEIDHLSFLDEDPKQRLKRYERMTQKAFSAFRIMDGKIWVEAPEPCYVALDGPQGFEQARESHDGFFPEDVEDDPHSWWWELPWRAFSATDYDNVVAGLNRHYDPPRRIEILIPDVLKVDAQALEIDRCARLIADVVTKNLASRGAKDQQVLRLPSTPCVLAWTSLVELIGSYDPFQGVPDEIEDVIENMLRAVEASPADADLISPHYRQLAWEYLERWNDRTFDLPLTNPLSVQP